MFLLKGFQKDGGLNSNKKESLFSEKVGGRLPNKKERRTALSQVKPQFAKIKVKQKRVNVVLQYLYDVFDR